MRYMLANQKDRKAILPLVPESLQSRLYLDETIVCVAKGEEREMTGFVLAEPGLRECQLLWLQVDESRRRCGVATMLFRELLEVLHTDEGIEQVTVEVPTETQLPAAFTVLLLRLGFQWEQGQPICRSRLDTYIEGELGRKKVCYEHIYSLRNMLSNRSLFSCWKRTERFAFALSDFSLYHEFEPDCSFVAEKNGQISAYLFIRKVDAKTLNIAYVAQQKKEVLTIIYLMNAAARAAWTKYGRDTELLMNAMTEKSRLLIEKLFPDGEWSREKLLTLPIR